MGRSHYPSLHRWVYVLVIVGLFLRTDDSTNTKPGNRCRMTLSIRDRIH